MKLVSASTMREMDRRTIDEFHIPGLILMENAALRVVDAIVERYGRDTHGLRARSWGDRTAADNSAAGARVVVMCGKGNNGGDGFAVARHLAMRYGADVRIWASFDPSSVSAEGDSAVNLRMAQSAGVPIRSFTESNAAELESEASSAAVVVDALFGTGVRGSIEGVPARMIDVVNGLGERLSGGSRPYVVAVDIPSGVDADTGNVDGPAIQADLTVTFGLAKPGLICYPGAALAGEVVVGDICMPRAVIDEAPAFVWTTEPVDIARWLPARENGRDSNKGKFGHLVVFAGSRGFMGAANMSSHSAARSGAGLVTLAVPDSLLPAAMTAASPVVMTKGLPETSEGTFAKSALDAALKLCEKASAVALGPGIGAHVDETAAFVREFVAKCPVPMVIDADALTVLASEPDHGVSILTSRSAGTVLTPHPGEMARLIGKSTSDVQAARFEVVCQAAERYQCTVLLKGARTLIASTGAPVNINVTGNAGMATGGAGDVLTGVIGALLGMKLDPHAAASAGACVHGLAGDIAAESNGGEAGLVATDIIDHLPAALGRCR